MKLLLMQKLTENGLGVLHIAAQDRLLQGVETKLSMSAILYFVVGVPSMRMRQVMFLKPNHLQAAQS